MAPITAFYAALLCPIFLVLTARVIQRRYQVRASVGDHGDAELIQRIRAHGNFIEFASFGLILTFLVEINSAPGWLVHVLGLCLIFGRLAHAAAFWSKMRFKLRQIGMFLSLTVILLACPILLVLSLA